MRLKLATALLSACVLGAVGCSTAWAEEYRGAVWTAGESIVKEPVKIKSKSEGSIKLEDTKYSAAVECHLTDEGTVESEGRSEITAMSFNECKAVKLCEGTITVKAVHLPWKSNLEEVEEKVNNSTPTGSGGEPGWKVECTVGGLKVTDECTGKFSQSTEETSGGVDLTFKSTRLKCSQGGAESGVTVGTDLYENPSSEKALGDPPTFRFENYTPLLGAPGYKMCEFSAINEKCTVEIRNYSLLPVKIIKKELVGMTAKERYEIETENCTSGLTLAARLPRNEIGGICVDTLKIKVNPVAGWENTYLVQAEGPSGNTVETSPSLLT